MTIEDWAMIFHPFLLYSVSIMLKKSGRILKVGVAKHYPFFCGTMNLKILYLLANVGSS